MAYIKSIEINQFRSIKKLSVSGFSNINLIVGDNNSGKTTLLEAIQLLFAKSQLGSIKPVIDQRTVLSPDKSSFYVSFIKMFNAAESRDQLEFDISAESKRGILRLQISGNEKVISGEEALQISSLSSRQKTQYKRESAFLPENAKIFTGSIAKQVGKKITEDGIRCTSLDSLASLPDIRKEVHYIPSFGHMRYDLLQNIVDDLDYKKLVIDILRQFDKDIADICYTKADDGSFLETIITKNGITMPFSVYGDGIKKILYILNRLYAASNSILLINEIETGLHKKYFDILFPVVFELAKKFNVQLFIATHSIEAIDAILRYGNYENSNEKEDPIKVITLKKVDFSDGFESNIVARNVTGKYVYDNRMAFDFEVRL